MFLASERAAVWKKRERSEGGGYPHSHPQTPPDTRSYQRSMMQAPMDRPPPVSHHPSVSVRQRHVFRLARRRSEQRTDNAEPQRPTLPPPLSPSPPVTVTQDNTHCTNTLTEGIDSIGRYSFVARALNISVCLSSTASTCAHQQLFPWQRLVFLLPPGSTERASEGKWRRDTQTFVNS